MRARPWRSRPPRPKLPCWPRWTTASRSPSCRTKRSVRRRRWFLRKAAKTNKRCNRTLRKRRRARIGPKTPRFRFPPWRCRFPCRYLRPPSLTARLRLLPLRRSRLPPAGRSPPCHRIRPRRSQMPRPSTRPCRWPIIPWRPIMRLSRRQRCRSKTGLSQRHQRQPLRLNRRRPRSALLSMRAHAASPLPTRHTRHRRSRNRPRPPMRSSQYRWPA